MFRKKGSNAYEKWTNKFERDHKQIQQLNPEERVSNYSYDNQSMQKELYLLNINQYTSDGVMSFHQFVKFLDDHRFVRVVDGETKDTSMFDGIQEI